GTAETNAGGAGDIGGRPGQPDASGLSEREKEVARLVLDGKTYREIGEAIYISPRTAEHHIARIRRRLGAENRSDLLARLRVALGVETSGQVNPQQE
ncbi:MAG: helix-turn-helix domain-containing protein, partial [Actinomycetes bacterium]